MSRVFRSALLAALLLSATRAQAQTFSPAAPMNTNAYFDSGSDRSVEIASDELGTMIAVWTSTDTLGGLLGGDRDILYARSEDAGASWSDPLPLAAEFLFDSSNDLEPRVTTDGAGNWIAVWRAQDPALDANIFDGDLMMVTSADSGLTWSTPVYLNSGSSPRIASDRAGMWMIVWAELGVAGADRDVMFSRSEDDGVSWSSALPLASNAGSDSGDDVLPVIASDEVGVWIAAWTSYDSLNGLIGTDGDVVYSRSLDRGQTWSAPLWLNANARTDTGLDTAVDLAADGAGHWIAVWTSFELIPWGGDGDILSARSSSDGILWSMPREIYTFALIELGAEYQPRIATDRAGEWMVVWWREDSLPGSSDEDYDVLFSRSLNHGANWSAPDLINPDALFDDGDDYAPSIATTRRGNWAVAWDSSSSFGGNTGSDFDIVLAAIGGPIEVADGGIDAGLIDGEVADAGVADVGIEDAGVADVGVEDAGVADVGVEDAGVADVGIADAGVEEIDAGVEGVDAGVEGVDAGVEGVDAGVEGVSDAGIADVGVEVIDAGAEVIDAGVEEIDAGAEVVVDAGVVVAADAGVVVAADAGVVVAADAGVVAADAGVVVDSGASGLPEDGGETPAQDDAGVIAVEADAGDATVEVDAGDAPVEVDAGDAPVEVDAGDAPVEVDAGDAPVEVDAGDAPVEVDAGDAPVEVDAGDAPVEADAGVIVVEADAGDAPVEVDAGDAPVEVDAGVEVLDSGVEASDSGVVVVADAGAEAGDAGAEAVDAGVELADSGLPVTVDDAGRPVGISDAGLTLARPDAGAGPDPFGGAPGGASVDFIDDQGCECNHTTSRSASSPLWIAALLPLIAFLRRRRG